MKATSLQMWVHRDCDLMFTLTNNKDQRKNRLYLRSYIKEPLNGTYERIDVMF